MRSIGATGRGVPIYAEQGGSSWAPGSGTVGAASGILAGLRISTL